MADTLTFTPGGTGGAALTVTPVPGTFQAGDGNEDRGGGNYAQSRAAKAANGSCEVELDSSACTLALLKALHEDCASDSGGVCGPVGEGNVAITGAGVFSAYVAYGCLIDIEIEGDSALRARISWKGHPIAP